MGDKQVVQLVTQIYTALLNHSDDRISEATRRQLLDDIISGTIKAPGQAPECGSIGEASKLLIASFSLKLLGSAISGPQATEKGRAGLEELIWEALWDLSRPEGKQITMLEQRMLLGHWQSNALVAVRLKKSSSRLQSFQISKLKISASFWLTSD